MATIKNILIKIKELTKNMLTLRAQLRLMETRLNNIDSKAQTPNYDISSPILTKTLDTNNIWMGEKGVNSYTNMAKLDVYYDESEDKWKVRGGITLKYIYVHIHTALGNEISYLNFDNQSGQESTNVYYYIMDVACKFNSLWVRNGQLDRATYALGFSDIHPHVFSFVELPNTMKIRVYTNVGGSYHSETLEIAITEENQIVTFIFGA